MFVNVILQKAGRGIDGHKSDNGLRAAAHQRIKFAFGCVLYQQYTKNLQLFRDEKKKEKKKGEGRRRKEWGYKKEKVLRGRYLPS